MITIAANAVHARLIDADRDAKLRVSTLLSYAVAGHEHTDGFQKGHWDGRASFFEFKNATFPAGFVNSTWSDLSRAGYKVRIHRKRPGAAAGAPIEEAYANAISPLSVDPRYDYQIETVRKLEKHGMIVAQVATGGGKSVIARTAVSRLMRPTIFITTRQVLMYQMKKGFEESGFRVGVMGDGEWSPVRGVNVAMVQTIASRLKKTGEIADNTRKLLQLFEFAILEEAHEASGSDYFEVMNNLPNAHYRLGLTGTPFMRADTEANMCLMAVSGQIGIKVTEKMLIDRGILATPIFKFAETPAAKDLRKTHMWQKAYTFGIINHEARNEAIIWEATRAVSHGLPVMILIQRKAHGEILYHTLKDRGVKVDYIFGDHDSARRQRALDRVREGKTEVLIGSTILDVGVDVPAVGMVINAGGGKAEVALRQRIGRGLRAKKSGPNYCLIMDFTDPGNRYLKEHSLTRRAIIEATPGFVENILKPGEDYPYERLGFPIAA